MKPLDIVEGYRSAWHEVLVSPCMASHFRGQRDVFVHALIIEKLQRVATYLEQRIAQVLAEVLE